VLEDVPDDEDAATDASLTKNGRNAQRAELDYSSSSAAKDACAGGVAETSIEVDKETSIKRALPL
jgi:hypothetical protein